MNTSYSSILPQNNHSHAGCYTFRPFSKRNMQKKKKIRMGKGEKGKAKRVPIIHRGSPPGSPASRGACLICATLPGTVSQGAPQRGDWFAFSVLRLSALTKIETPLPDSPLGENKAVISKARIDGAHSRKGLTTAVTLTLWRREVWRPGCSEGHRKGKARWARGGGC